MEKITPNSELTKSKDLVAENIEKLKELFPEINTEGHIDFKVLKQILGEEIEEDEEFYRMTWAGKSMARMEAQKPSTGTLRPCKDESVDWETTENLYVEGDNLEVLKLLQKSYAGKVKMIYIDPPYNTGKDFVYKDNYKDNLKNYQEVTGQIDSEGKKLTTNSDSDGRYHSNWLNMMYPRLKLAKNLLSDDGVIFMSIDDNEVDNLRKLGTEIFGEHNFITTFVWRRRKTQANLAKHIAPVHDFILAFSKKNEKLKLNRVPFSEEFIKRSFSNPDDDSRGLYQTGPLARPANSSNREYELEMPNGRKITAKWSCSQETFNELVKDNRLVIPRDGQGMPRKKIFLSELEGLLPNTWLDNIASNDDGAKEIADLFGSNAYFSYPKPTKLLEFLLNFGSSEGDVVLDFFSGSASTAHAVLNLNSESTHPRKFIAIQLPEEIDSKNPAHKEGFETISRLGAERIRRAGKAIIEENKKLKDGLDAGFRFFSLDTSNIKPWDGNPEDLKNNLFNAEDNIKEGRTAEDVLYEVLLKYGLDLTLPIEQREIAGQKVFNVGHGAMFVCLDEKIKAAVAEGIGKWKEEVEPEICRAIFRDAGFSDVDKTNATQTLKKFGITEVKSI